MSVSVMRKLLFEIIIFSLWLTTTKCELRFYGNEVKERSTSGMDGSLQPGPRVWIDDPLNGESWPKWGYLAAFRVYIHQMYIPILPTIHLQIWTNTSMINNYTLKWQKTLPAGSYQNGTSYELPVDDGQVVEVTEYDRLGFTNEGNYSTIALDLEVDDTISASTAHRTYFRFLYRDNYKLPVVGDSKYVDNNALRGRFSIGILLDTGPPRSSSQAYCGHALKNGMVGPGYPSQYIVDDSTMLSSGRVTAFYFRLGAMTSATPFQLQIWQKTSGSNYILRYNRSVTLSPISAAKTYNVTISDGLLVDSGYRFGWMTPAAPIFYSFNSNVTIYKMEGGSDPYSIGQSYSFDGLPWTYEFSIGVIVDQMTNSSTERTKTTINRDGTNDLNYLRSTAAAELRVNAGFKGLLLFHAIVFVTLHFIRLTD